MVRSEVEGRRVFAVGNGAKVNNFLVPVCLCEKESERTDQTKKHGGWCVKRSSEETLAQAFSRCTRSARRHSTVRQGNFIAEHEQAARGACGGPPSALPG